MSHGVGIQAQFEEFKSHLSLPVICGLSLIDDVFFMIVGANALNKGLESKDISKGDPVHAGHKLNLNFLKLHSNQN